jgi:3-oxoacyl-[acyl-carrier protein] reductase
MSILQDRVVLVTGGSGDIGHALCTAFAQAGAKVATTSRRGAEALGSTIEAIEAAGSEALPLACDVRDRGQVEETVKTVVATWGKIDILVNNAGITKDTLLMRMSDEQWDDVIATNLKSVFLGTQAAIRPMMKARYGRIISITSIVGQIGNAGQANYASAKAGIIGFTKTVAKELASRGITANAIAPGFIESKMTDEIPEKAKEAFLDSVPLKRPGDPMEVAHAAVFLASEQSAYITGQVLNVDGGLVM